MNPNHPRLSFTFTEKAAYRLAAKTTQQEQASSSVMLWSRGEAKNEFAFKNSFSSPSFEDFDFGGKSAKVSS